MKPKIPMGSKSMKPFQSKVPMSDQEVKDRFASIMRQYLGDNQRTSDLIRKVSESERNLQREKLFPQKALGPITDSFGDHARRGGRDYLGRKRGRSLSYHYEGRYLKDRFGQFNIVDDNYTHDGYNFRMPGEYKITNQRLGAGYNNDRPYIFKTMNLNDPPDTNNYNPPGPPLPYLTGIILKPSIRYPMRDQLKDRLQTYEFKTMIDPFKTRLEIDNAYPPPKGIEYGTNIDLADFRHSFEETERPVAITLVPNFITGRKNQVTLKSYLPPKGIEYGTTIDLADFKHSLEETERSVAISHTPNIITERQNQLTLLSQEKRGKVNVQTNTSTVLTNSTSILQVYHANNVKIKNKTVSPSKNKHESVHTEGNKKTETDHEVPQKQAMKTNKKNKSTEPSESKLNTVLDDNKTSSSLPMKHKKNKKRRERKYIMEKYLNDSECNLETDNAVEEACFDEKYIKVRNNQTEDNLRDKSKKSRKDAREKVLTRSSPVKVSKATSCDANMLQNEQKYHTYDTEGINTSETDFEIIKEVSHKAIVSHGSRKPKMNDFHTAVCLEENNRKLNNYSKTVEQFKKKHFQEETLDNDGSSKIINGVLVKLSKSMHLQADCKEALKNLKNSMTRKNKNGEKRHTKRHNGKVKICNEGIFKENCKSCKKNIGGEDNNNNNNESTTEDSQMDLCSSCEYGEMLDNFMKPERKCDQYDSSNYNAEVYKSCSTIVIDVRKLDRRTCRIENEEYEETMSERSDNSDHHCFYIEEPAHTEHGHNLKLSKPRQHLKNSSNYIESPNMVYVNDLDHFETNQPSNKSKTLAELLKPTGPDAGVSEDAMIGQKRWYHFCLGK